jgi:hypothetical protein
MVLIAIFCWWAKTAEQNNTDKLPFYKRLLLGVFHQVDEIYPQNYL